MIDRRRAREKLARHRQERWQDYEKAAAAICDGDAGLAEVFVDCATRSLRRDLEFTGGYMAPEQMPHPVDVDVPPADTLDGELLTEMYWSLLEAVGQDPTVEPASDGV